jgi:hypothetical protein
MSEEEAPSGLVIAEKLFGFLIFIVGLILTYVTYTSFTAFTALGKDVEHIPNALFLAGSLLLTGLGVFIMIAKTE